jgi:CheY-like chemotaxis protein
MGIINDILQVSELHHKVLEIETRRFSIQGLLFRLEEVMGPKLEKKNLQLLIEVAEEVPTYVIGDKTRLSQILYNLVGNAIKFTDIGTISLFVKVVQQEEEQLQLFFSVSDTGIGIPAIQQEKIFEPFTRLTQKDRVTEGTGLGLAITKQLVEMQGGKIQLSSEEGKGSTFSFVLSFDQEATPMMDSNTEGQTIKCDEDLVFKVLIVEDHEMNQLVVKKTLEKQWNNIQITIANNGEEAIKCLSAQDTYDIILMDLQMPVMDGYETTAYIRNKMPPPIANIPILAMTAHTHIAEGNKFRDLGMNDYLLKPFDPQQLFEKIVNYLDKTLLNA